MEYGYKNWMWLAFIYYRKYSETISMAVSVEGDVSPLEPLLEAKQFFNCKTSFSLIFLKGSQNEALIYIYIYAPITD